MKKKMFYALSALLLCSACTTTPRNPFEEPARPAGQESVLKLACEPLDTVRVGFIGLGSRGKGAIERYVYLPDAKVVALCDLDSANVNKANEILTSHKLPAADIYVGEDVWKEMCGRDDIDLVYICTDWHSHAPMAVYAMKQGKHVAVEVPAAMTVAECWDLVNTAEQTRRHCMMLENCCYDFFEMATLNMAQQGLFGDVMHAEGAYIHDLRSYNYDTTATGYKNMWRLKAQKEEAGNPYPTHGLGPVAQILNIHRGDRMATLVSTSLKSRSRIFREVTYFPSRPAKGLLFTMNIIDTVGSSIFTKGRGSTHSGSQAVSPIFRSVIPDTAIRSPRAADWASTLFKPSNWYILVILACLVVPSLWHRTTLWPVFTWPRSTLPVATVPRPVMVKTSSTGIRKGRSDFLSGVGIYSSTAFISSRIGA